MERLSFRKILPPINRGTPAAKRWPSSRTGNGPPFQPREKTPFMSAVHNSSTAKNLLDLVSRNDPKDKEKIMDLLDKLWRNPVLTGNDHEAIEAAQKFLRELSAT